MPKLIRPLKPTDLEAIEALLHANRPVFSDVEIATAMELVREAVGPPAGESDPYLAIVAESQEGEVLGYACYGSVPMTEGTYDLYWIAVHPGRHGAGVGRKLLESVEEAVRAKGGYLVVIETSSRKDYDKTRAFYEKMKYERAAWIKDFYKKGDDKVLYVKHL